MLTLPQSSLRPGDRVCVAISGGADSTALLMLVHAANALPRGALGVGLSAIHVNHALRDAESDGDQAFVADLCAKLSVPLHLERVDTRARARDYGETLEEAARSLRYAAFASLLTRDAANIVLTAHTLDDQAETVLMKLLRGAWLEGLSGISPVLDVSSENGRTVGRVVRPLLAVARTDLRAYLTGQGQLWREDSSNSDEAFTRNRLRATVLPILRQENPSLDHTLANLAELAREEEARWKGELARILPQIILPGRPVRGGGRANSTQIGAQAIAIELDRLRTLDPALRRRVVRAAARQLGSRLTFEETGRLLTLAGFSPQVAPDPTVPAKTGGKLQLSQGLLAERSLRELRLTVTGAAAGLKEVSGNAGRV